MPLTELRLLRLNRKPSATAQLVEGKSPTP